MPPRQKRHIPKDPVQTPFGVFLWGGEEKFTRRTTLHGILSTNPIFSKTSVVIPSLSRKDAWTRSALQAHELIRLKLIHKWTHTDFMDAVRLTDNMLPVAPQFRIFMSNLLRQMSDEQQAEWIPRAERFEICGSYAQTELGHGSNVKGIETTATFDEERDEFVIESPTLSSTKYWIGATGVWATHSLVVARLVLKGKEYGNHLFLVQIRDLGTQKVMPGVEIYELGPKAFQGMLGTDNGAMRFQRVRVPRRDLLARNAKVTREGEYVKPENEKHSYGSMVTVRAIMAEITGWDLLKAVAVAYHYTSYRKQFGKTKEQDEETTVIDYASVKQRLVPLLAQGTALVLVGQRVKKGYDDFTANNIKTGDFSKLEDFHLQTVGSKVYSTEITAHGVETCRIACGGHGYHALSGFGRMYANTCNALTYEGDNYVIAQQVPRAILKHYKKKTEHTVPSLSYLGKLRDSSGIAPPRLESVEDWYRPEVHRWALERRLVTLVRMHMEDTDAGRDTSYTVHALTMAHSDFVYWRGFRETLERLEKGEAAFLEHVRSLYLVFSLSILQHPHHPSLVQALQISPEQSRDLRAANTAAIENLAANHMDHVISAYGFTEYEMDSALARSDKEPYEALFEEGAKNSEMSGQGMSHLWDMMINARQLWRRVGSEKDTKARL